jgi:DNA repair protein RadA/Sms
MKIHPVHVCRQCGTTSPRWAGRCAGCGEWNTLEEFRAATSDATRATPLRDIGEGSWATTPTGVGELDRVLGGGLTAGSTTLLFGEPGVGKSTLALMALRAVASTGPVLLVAAEESVPQVARRARRLGEVPDSLTVASIADVDAALSLIRAARPVLAVVDSVSAMSDGAIAGGSGSVAQVRHAAERLCRGARDAGTALVLVGHVTKDGELAGPRALEHLVDTVVRIEGDRHGTLRLLRALKHRFGPTGEVGLLEMGPSGLVELADAALALRGPQLDVPGVVFSVANDGSRSTLVELQALVASSPGSPRRVAHQVSAQRLSLLLAVLEARCGVVTSGVDVFAASAAGLPATDPGVDVALALAVASASLGFAVPGSLAALGEVGLAGELRPVPGAARRVREAGRLGAATVLVPEGSELDDAPGVVVRRCRSLAEALELAKPRARRAG